jgi:hypothetical protein
VLWGAGRLLIYAVRAARASVADRRSSLGRAAVLRAAVALLVVALVGGGQRSEIATSSGSRTDGAQTFAGGPSLFGLAGPALASRRARDDTVTVAVKPTARPHKRHALIVGINHAPGARALQGAVADAQNVEQALLAYGFAKNHITTLLDAEATRSKILSSLETLARKTPTDGIAVVAIAAHTRVRGGVNQLLAADGQRVNSTEIASRLQRLRSPAWIALPTCYAAGYALPGIVGHNRVATFASSGNAPSYELGRAGSYLILNMVRRAMLDAEAPRSVESAFAWAYTNLARSSPNRVPTMSDGVEGDLVLGEVTWSRPKPVARQRTHQRRPSNDPPVVAADAGGQETANGSPKGEPERTPPPSYTVQVCGRYAVNCRR